MCIIIIYITTCSEESTESLHNNYLLSGDELCDSVRFVFCVCTVLRIDGPRGW